MKPFDLQAALNGAKVVTRDGREVKIAGYNPEGMEYWQKLTGWVRGYSYQWNEAGQHYTACGSQSDLFMAPTERKEWIVRVERDNKVAIWGPYNDLGYVQSAYNYEVKHGTATIHEITIHE